MVTARALRERAERAGLQSNAGSALGSGSSASCGAIEFRPPAQSKPSLGDFASMRLSSTAMVATMIEPAADKSAYRLPRLLNPLSSSCLAFSRVFRHLCRSIALGLRQIALAHVAARTHLMRSGVPTGVSP